MQSVVLARLRAKYKAKEDKPADLLQGFADTAPSRERTVTKTVERVMEINLAAIHTTSSVSFVCNHKGAARELTSHRMRLWPTDLDCRHDADCSFAGFVHNGTQAGNTAPS